MSADYVRRYYGVPGKRGMRIEVDGRPGRIMSFPDAHVGVRFDDEPRWTQHAHPTWRMTYFLDDGTTVEYGD